MTSSAKNSVEISSQSDGTWIVRRTQFATVDGLKAAVAVADAALRGGPEKRVSVAIRKLQSLTRKPAHFTEDTDAIYHYALRDAMMDYPVDIVEQACADWRKTPSGEWWPAEAELRKLCDKLVAARRSLHARVLMVA